MIDQKQFNFQIFLATRQQMAIAIALGVGAVGLLLFGILPQGQQALELRAELEKEEPKLVALERKLSDLENIKFTPEFGQADLVEAALPSKKPLLELMMSLSSIAIETGVVIEDFEISPGQIASDSAALAQIQAESRRNRRNTAIDSLDLKLMVSGSFSQVQNFLILIEKISPFTTINTLTLGVQAQTNQNQEQLIETTLSTKTYYFTQSVQTTVEAPLPKLNNQDVAVLNELSTFVASDLPEQTEILGGGLEDLFDVEGLDFNSATESGSTSEN